MAHAAGIAGQVHPFGEGVHAPHAGAQTPKFGLGEVGGLIDQQPVVALPLVFAFHRRAVAGQVAKADGRAIGEAEQTRRFVVGGHRRRHQAAQRADQRVVQLLQASSDQQHSDARIPQRTAGGLVENGPGFPAASGPAVADVFGVAQEERFLCLGVCPSQV